MKNYLLSIIGGVFGSVYAGSVLSILYDVGFAILLALMGGFVGYIGNEAAKIFFKWIRKKIK